MFAYNRYTDKERIIYCVILHKLQKYFCAFCRYLSAGAGVTHSTHKHGQTCLCIHYRICERSVKNDFCLIGRGRCGIDHFDCCCGFCLCSALGDLDMCLVDHLADMELKIGGHIRKVCTFVQKCVLDAHIGKRLVKSCAVIGLNFGIYTAISSLVSLFS